MGVTIDLLVDFGYVSQAQWESVYDETLKLIDAYPFMDKIVDESTYRETFIYADRTRDRFLSPWYPDRRGWYTIGDLESFDHAESFMLARDVTFYGRGDRNGEPGDVYFSLINWRSGIHPEIRDIETSATGLFDGKTQGYGYHKHLLAIACLVEDRLKPHAAVHGDITRAQIQQSLTWANDHLSKPVAPPDRCDYRALLSRIKEHLQSEAAQIEALLELALYPENRELGDFVRESFSHDSIVDYWKSNLKDNAPDTYGMVREMTRYLDMGFSIEDLCDILVLDDNESFMRAQSFIKTLLKTGILDSEPEADALSLNDQDDPVPETVFSLFAKSGLAMAGFRDATNRVLDEQELKEMLYTKFDRNDVVDEAFAEHQNASENRTLAGTMDELLAEMTGESSDGAAGEDTRERYDIESPADILHWKEGDSLHPDVRKIIGRIADFSDGLLGEINHEISGADLEMRIGVLLTCNRFFLIGKDTWDYIFERVHDDRALSRIISLLSVKADEISLNTVMKCIFNNPRFLERFFLTE